MDRGFHLGGNDVGQCGFAEAWRAVEQQVVERFAALLRGFEEDGQVGLELILTDEFAEPLRAERQLVPPVFGQALRGEFVLLPHDASRRNAHLWCAKCAAELRVPIIVSASPEQP